MAGSPESLRRLAETAARIGRRRARLLDELRSALLQEDTPRVYAVGRHLTGLEEEEIDEAEGNRTHPGQH